jgi:hypothetical protein
VGNDKELNMIAYTKRQQSCLKKYGYDNPFNSKHIQSQIQNENIVKYGVPFKLLSKDILNKIKETNIRKYGVEYVTSSKTIQNKMKTSMMKNHGVTSPCKNADIQLKCQRSAKKTKDYQMPSSVIIQLQGYEPQFLDHIFNNNLIEENEIRCGFKQIPKIPYTDSNNKQHIYFPDFYIPKWNLIVEVKSRWTLLLDKNYPHKKTYTQKQYDFLTIIDNNFTELNEYIIKKQELTPIGVNS